MSNLRILRNFLSWNFAFLSLVCVVLGYWIIRRSLDHRGIADYPHPWALILFAVFPAMAAVFGIAWWKVWRERSSARPWGIAASLTLMIYPLRHIFFATQPFANFTIITLAVGIVGLVVFAMPEGPRTDADDPHPNDGLL
jgi:hypothetical protein